MDEDTFLERARTEAGLETTTAARGAADAVLRTLAEHLAEGEAEDLAAAVPGEIGDALLDAPSAAESFDLDEFLARVAERAGVDESGALARTRGVFAALDEAAGDELADAREQLPGEFDLAFETGSPTTANEFVAAVGDAAGLTGDDARPVVEAVLRALGERVSRGEAEDLATYLPDALSRALLAESRDEASDYDRDGFLARVAERGGGSRADAERNARAVFAVLAEVAGEGAMADVRSQLPASFDSLLRDS